MEEISGLQLCRSFEGDGPSNRPQNSGLVLASTANVGTMIECLILCVRSMTQSSVIEPRALTTKRKDQRRLHVMKFAHVCNPLVHAMSYSPTCKPQSYDLKILRMSFLTWRLRGFQGKMTYPIIQTLQTQLPNLLDIPKHNLQPCCRKAFANLKLRK